MARENRSDNRRKAKEGTNENDETIPDGTDFSDMLEEDLSGDEEDKQDDKLDIEEEKDASEGEEDKKKSSDTADVDNGEEEGKQDEDTGKSKSPEELAAEVAASEKATKEAEAKAKAEEPAKKPEPTQEEKDAAAAKAKANKETADAKAAEEAKASKPLSDEEAQTLFTEWRTTTEDLLAQHHYRLNDDMVAELNENPAAFIPKMMSKVYLDSISASFQQFAVYLPRMVNQVLMQRENVGKEEKEFFDTWPDLLVADKGKDTVYRLGAAYRAQNPTASREEFINEVGAQAMVALRLTPKPKEEAKPNGNGVTKPKDKGFKPASTGGSEPPKSKQTVNPFEQLANEFSSSMEEELDDN